ncbi:MAG: hypothetical protein BJ554DRAFT_3511, partial [Olpidium bornovanus]
MMRNLQGALSSSMPRVSMWKQKYEALAKLYAQLRQEHLDLLGKYKTANQRAATVVDAVSRMEKAQAEVNAKSVELADANRDRD